MKKDITKKDAIEYAGRRFAEVYRQLDEEDHEGRPVELQPLLAVRAQVAELAGTLVQLMRVLGRDE